MFAQGPHIIGQSTAITAMNLTTAWMKFFVNTTQSESKFVCDTKQHNYRTEQTESERTFASFSSEITVNCTQNLPVLFHLNNCSPLD